MPFEETPTGIYSPSTFDIVHNVDVNFLERRQEDIAHVVQYDDMLPVVAAHLYYGAEPYSVPEGAHVNVRVRKSDKTYSYNDAIGISDDRQTVYIGITQRMTAAPGLAFAIIEIIKDGTAGTSRFVLSVEENPISDEAIESSNEFISLKEYVDAAEKASKTAADASESASASAKTAEEAAGSASASAEKAQEAAKDAQKPLLLKWPAGDIDTESREWNNPILEQLVENENAVVLEVGRYQYALHHRYVGIGDDPPYYFYFRKESTNTETGIEHVVRYYAGERQQNYYTQEIYAVSAKKGNLLPITSDAVWKAIQGSDGGGSIGGDGGGITEEEADDRYVRKHVLLWTDSNDPEILAANGPILKELCENGGGVVLEVDNYQLPLSKRFATGGQVPAHQFRFRKHATEKEAGVEYVVRYAVGTETQAYLTIDIEANAATEGNRLPITSDAAWRAVEAAADTAGKAMQAANEAAEVAASAVDSADKKIEEALAAAKASGAFDGKSAYQSYRENGGALTEDQWLASLAQGAPAFARSVEDMTDTGKVYVMPDGYIWAYMAETVFTNLFSYEKASANFSWISGSSENQIYATSSDYGYKDTANNRFVSLKSLSNGRFAATGGVSKLPSGKYTVSAEVFVPSGTPGSVVAFGVCLIPSNKGAYKNYTIPSFDTWTKVSYEFTVANGDLYTYIAMMHATSDSKCYWRNIEVLSAEDKGRREYTWKNTGLAYTPADYEDRIIQLEKQAAKADSEKWKGKKWVVFGDSLTEANLRTTKHYFDYIAEKTGISIVNMGASGTGYKRTFDTGTAFYQRILKVPEDADVVTIFGSGNDLSTTWNTYGLGEVTDSGTDTICGCINKTIDNLYSVLPTVQLGIITPTPWDAFYPSAVSDPANRMSRYSEAIVKICEMRGIPCLDLYHCSGLRPWDASFKKLAYSKDEGSGTHPDETGHAIIAPRIKAFLDSLIL